MSGVESIIFSKEEQMGIENLSDEECYNALRHYTYLIQEMIEGGMRCIGASNEEYEVLENAISTHPEYRDKMNIVITPGPDILRECITLLTKDN